MLLCFGRDCGAIKRNVGASLFRGVTQMHAAKKDTSERRHVTHYVAYTSLKPDHDIPYTRKTISSLCKRGMFPQPVQLSPNRIAWVLDEILAWKESRPRVVTHKHMKAEAGA